jgi:hypothetical protein
VPGDVRCAHEFAHRPTLQLTGTCIVHNATPAQQLAAPWGDYCCAEAARVVGLRWHRMTRLMRRAGLANPKQGMRGVRISPDQLKRIAMIDGASSA